MNNHTTKKDTILDKGVPQIGQLLDRFWTRTRQLLDSHPTGSGQGGASNWTRTGHLLVTLWTCLALSACGLTERITRSHTVQVDTVQHDVPTPGHVVERRFAPADSIFFEDDRLSIALTRLPGVGNLSSDTTALGMSGSRIFLSDSTHPRAATVPADVWKPPNGWQLRAEVKPETVRVQLPQKTITETETKTKFVRRTPGLVKYIIGGLITVIIILVVAWRLTK